MTEDEIWSVMGTVWKAIEAESPDAKDQVLFELYRQREIYRHGLERIAAYPYKGWTQQVAEDTLDAVAHPPGKVSMLNKAVEAAVNRGLAATVLDDVRAGAEIMCKAGVPFEVSRRVLLHPTSRRATDWRGPGDILALHPDRRRGRPPGESTPTSS